MAIHHAHAGQIIDLNTWGRDLPQVNKVIAKTPEMEIQELILKAGEFHFRIAEGPLVAQCLSGEIDLSSPDGVNRLSAFQLLLLRSNVPHSIKAITDATMLIIIVSQVSIMASTHSSANENIRQV